MRVISSPSISTTGFFTLILAIRFYLVSLCIAVGTVFALFTLNKL